MRITQTKVVVYTAHIYDGVRPQRNHYGAEEGGACKRADLIMQLHSYPARSNELHVHAERIIVHVEGPAAV